MIILALDLASVTGWALGAPGEIPRSGSIRFARSGHSMAAHFRGCRTWLTDFVTISKPDIVVFEGPLAPSYVAGNTNTDVVRALMGLIAIVEEALYDTRIQVREATVSNVRAFFLGTNRIKRDEAKVATKRRCRELGWPVTDDNSADALALWAYMVNIVSPQDGVKFLPLFRKQGVAI
jgi:crossover junction endodeoxyribonuclease RuvC